MLKSGRVDSGEDELIRRIADGDRAAFQSMYRIYFPRLARFLDRMVRNTPLIEEIVNDTMLVVWQKAHTFDRSCKVSTWVFGIAYRQGLKAVNRVDEPVESDFESQPGDASQEPEQAALALRLRQDVGRALDALPLEQRVVVSLTYYHDMAYQEIAEAMNCPVNTVKTRMFHARQRLRGLLSAHMEEMS
ncbi:RNA polymerase sigma factor [Pseudoduganella namucuonensis]|uniref:RNA polymerase sigma-70 factor, ECF subfamily n=1 Tax=Pseudoduganella namucuonensis TaxID=1035707 RepID=A0A1I7KT66_9BURK|nr:sigma-70 family RNA polymerase sigma factor [Pseudoduganella namucuonensis]SFV00662.1 RNA polymerase sigma-70 factor, ECF subfamily [Pseudoduganella namucuonensis]